MLCEWRRRIFVSIDVFVKGVKFKKKGGDGI